LLSGCAVGPRYQPPTLEVPEAWHEPAETGLAAGDADVQAWWQVFADDTLSSLIGRAAEGNLDLRMAVLRIRQARALRGVAAGGLLPTLAGQKSYQRYKASANGAMGGRAEGPGRGAQFAEAVGRGTSSGAVAQGLGTALPGAPALTNSAASGLVGLVPSRTERGDTDAMDLFVTGFDASWELDVFGGTRRGVEAADAELAAAVEDYRGVLVSLLAEVATTYIDLRALQAQIDASRHNIDLQKQTLVLTRARFEAELTSELDVHQALTNLATTEAGLPVLETGVAIAVYRLGVLLGLEPAALRDELSAPGTLPQVPEKTFVGVPADILRRRPDLRAAERRLAAQTARIGVAAAELYPRLTLAGTLGLEATDINHAFDGRSVTYGFGPAVRWNIFDGLRNLNRIAAQEAATHQAYVSYQQALLVALQDVESALVAYKSEQVRRDALVRADEAARSAVRLARTRYEDGLADFQSVLDAQRSLVTLDNAVAQSQGQVAVNLVAVYKALGGGWSPDKVPQGRYLDNGFGVLADPVGFFLSGGNVALPWESGPEHGADGDATAVKEE